MPFSPGQALENPGRRMFAAQDNAFGSSIFFSRSTHRLSLPNFWLVSSFVRIVAGKDPGLGQASMAAHLCRPNFIPFSFSLLIPPCLFVKYVPLFDDLGLFRPEERRLLISEPDQHLFCLQSEAQQHPAFRPCSSLCPFLCKHSKHHSRWHTHLWPP